MIDTYAIARDSNTWANRTTSNACWTSSLVHWIISGLYIEHLYTHECICIHRTYTKDINSFTLTTKIYIKWFGWIHLDIPISYSTSHFTIEMSSRGILGKIKEGKHLYLENTQQKAFRIWSSLDHIFSHTLM